LAFILVGVAVVVIVAINYTTLPQDGVLTPEMTPETTIPETTIPETTPETTPESSQDWLWSHPSPHEIYESIDALAPYLQGDARQNYEGLSVTWGVELVGIIKRTDGTYIQTYSLEQYQELVTFYVDINEYPQLKIMETGQEFVVQGSIIEVDRIAIQLSDCHLTFD